jgi:imidazolonepropionase-like amidohydrolase/Tol biopolymer transport system component
MSKKTLILTVVLLSLSYGTSYRKPAQGRAVAIAEFQVSPARANHAALSPDGAEIVFTLMGLVFVGSADGGEAKIIGGEGHASWPAWKTDGKHILFSDGPDQVLHEIGFDGKARHLTQKPGDRPADSPDGRLIAFARNNKLWILERAGVQERMVAEDVFPGTFPVWSPDGRELFFIQGKPEPPYKQSIVAVDVRQSGHPARKVADVPGAFRFTFSNDGSRVAVLRWQGDDFTTKTRSHAFQVWAMDSTFAEPKRVTEVEGLSWQVFNRFPSGDFLVATGDALLRVSADGSSVKPIQFKASVRLPYIAHSVPRISLPEPGSRHPVKGFSSPRVSPDGRSVAFSALGDIWIAGLESSESKPRRFNHPAHDMHPSWFPAGDRLAFVSDRGGDYDIWILETASGEAVRATSLPGEETSPCVSPDGEWIAFSFFGRGERVDSAERAYISIVHPDGSSMRQVGQAHSLMSAEPIAGWMPDGSAVLIPTTGVRPGIEGERLRAVPLSGDKPFDVNDWPSRARRMAWPAVSLNRIAFERGEQLWLQNLSERKPAGEPQLVGNGLGYWASFSADGKRLLCLSPEGPTLHDLTEGSSRKIDFALSYEVPPSRPLVLANARIAGQGEQRFKIRLENSRIIKISPSDDTLATPEAEELDLAGRIVIPGLIDGHVHLSPNSYWRKSFLAFGVTTVVDLGSEPLACLALNEAFDSGALPGPRIIYAGDVVSQGAFVGSYWRPLANEEEARRYMERQYALGARVLKLYQPLDALIEPLVRMAREKGLYVTGHNAFPAVTYGAHAAEHTQSDEEIALLRAVGATMTPTLVTVDTFKGYAYWTRAEALQELFMRSDWWPPYAKDGLQRRISEKKPDEAPPENPWVKRVSEAWRSGLNLLAGTDGGGVDAGLALHWELERLVDAGLRPSEALAAATLKTAQALGLGSELGEVKPGYRADLLILEADPYEDIRNTQKIWMVIKDGRVVHQR